MTTPATTPTESPSARTPGVVTLVAILALITGLFCLLAGIMLVIAGFGDPAALGQSTLVLVLQGIAYLILGFAALAVFKALRAGQHWARILFTVVLVCAALVDISNIVLGHSVSSSIWGIAVDVLALILLWVPASVRAFFDAHRS